VDLLDSYIIRQVPTLVIITVLSWNQVPFNTVDSDDFLTSDSSGSHRIRANPIYRILSFPTIQIRSEFSESGERMSKKNSVNNRNTPESNRSDPIAAYHRISNPSDKIRQPEFDLGWFCWMCFVWIFLYTTDIRRLNCLKIFTW
jgi:hypothetical protein